eukprot:4038079-Prymnesium_polylepis.1
MPRAPSRRARSAHRHRGRDHHHARSGAAGRRWSVARQAGDHLAQPAFRHTSQARSQHPWLDLSQ